MYTYTNSKYKQLKHLINNKIINANPNRLCLLTYTPVFISKYAPYNIYVRKLIKLFITSVGNINYFKNNDNIAIFFVIVKTPVLISPIIGL